MYVTIDTAPLELHTARLSGVIVQDSIPVISDSHKKRILGLTASGANYLGEIFGPYNADYAKVREKLGLQTDIKDLRKTGDMLDSLGLFGDMLTVAADQRGKALGQVTGRSGAWPYKHEFLNVSEEGNQIAAVEMAAHIREVLF